MLVRVPGKVMPGSFPGLLFSFCQPPRPGNVCGPSRIPAPVVCDVFRKRLTKRPSRFPCRVVHSAASHKKEPTCTNTRRSSSTSAYSSSGPPGSPGCPSSSHPTRVLVAAQLARQSSADHSTIGAPGEKESGSSRQARLLMLPNPHVGVVSCDDLLGLAGDALRTTEAAGALCLTIRIAFVATSAGVHPMPD